MSIRVAWQGRIAVLIGGGLGVAARFGISLIFSSAVVGTFVVNVLGAGALGYVLARLRLAGQSRSVTVPLLGVGFLGAFTTFSSLAVQLVEGPLLRSLAYGVASLAAGIVAGMLGLTLGRQA